MEKPIIGIVARKSKSEDGFNVMGIGEYYRLAIINNGGIPITILPTQEIIYNDYSPKNIKPMNNQNVKDLLKVLDICDGILMIGGNAIYEHDLLICKYAIKKNIPILGICMGMQVMGILDNNKEKVLEKIESKINHHQLNKKDIHKVYIEENTFLKKILDKDNFFVNSVHNYKLTKTNKFKVAAYSEDGIIEAIELFDKGFVLGVQWHPEKEYDNLQSKKIFQSFIEASKKTVKE